MEPLTYEQIEQLVQKAIREKAREKNIDLSGVAFADQLDLRVESVLDSLDIVSLLSTLESATGIEIEFEEIEPEQLTRYSSLVQMFCGGTPTLGEPVTRPTKAVDSDTYEPEGPSASVGQDSPCQPIGA